MANPFSVFRSARPRTSARQDPALVRWGLTLAAVAVLGILVVVPVVHVFAQALANGPLVYWENLFGDADTRHALLLTLTVLGNASVAAQLTA